MPKGSEPKLTVAQLQIMELFWERGELTVAEVWSALKTKRPIARNTVLTFLTRLTTRGWLKSRSEGNTFWFRATRPRVSTLRSIVGQLVDTAFGGSASRMLMTLIEARSLTPEEAQHIRELIDRSQEIDK
jgi:BlaI family penicillinase repressor